MVNQRINLAIVEIQRFFVEGHIHSSVGARLEVWRISLTELFPQAPWFGVGVHQFKPSLAKLAAEGRIDERFTWISHPHNEWLYVIVEQGVFGFVALASLYGGSYWVISKTLINHPSESELRLATRLLIIGMLTFGLTDVMTGNLITATFFCALLAWLQIAASKPMASNADQLRTNKAFTHPPQTLTGSKRYAN
ncbi:hypothetical protein GCM10025776_28000 [Corallincola platygyrae]